MSNHHRNDKILSLLLLIWALYGLTILVVLVVTSLAHKPIAIIVWFLVSWAGLTGFYALLAFLDYLATRMIQARFAAQGRGEVGFCIHCQERMTDLLNGKFVRLGRLGYLAGAMLRCEGWIGPNENRLEDGEPVEVQLQDRERREGSAQETREAARPVSV